MPESDALKEAFLVWRKALKAETDKLKKAIADADISDCEISVQDASCRLHAVDKDKATFKVSIPVIISTTFSLSSSERELLD